MAENHGVKVNTTYNQYLKLFLNYKKYIIFEEEFKLNIVGIRKAHDYSDVLKEPDKAKKKKLLIENHDNFDDTLVVFYNDEKQNTKYFICNEFTTHPGYEPLSKEPSINYKTNKAYTGTAILVEGQYINYWEKGPHGKSKYQALVQKSNTNLMVYRDPNKNGMLNMESKYLWNHNEHPFEGGVEIDIHRANIKLSDRIWIHSEGCQVIRRAEEYNKFMKLVDLQIKNGCTNFSYTLISQDELNNFISNKIKEENIWYKLIKDDKL